MLFVGNKKAVSFLERVMDNDAVNHAYIFSGPDQVGKRTLAELFARSLILGKNLDVDTDDEAADANDIYRSDLAVLAPEVDEKGGVSKQKGISVSQVREAQQFLVAYPYLGKKKVLVIDDAHKMTVSAQNAMLKILEEPNSTSMLILITNEIDQILLTIRSRCQVVGFNLVENAAMLEAFGANFDKKTLALSMGRPGMAKTLMGDHAAAKEKYAEVSTLLELPNISLTQRLQLAEKYAKNIAETVQLLRLWTWLLHGDCAEGENAPQMAQNYGTIAKVNESISDLTTTNANGRLVLEKLFLSI